MIIYSQLINKIINRNCFQRLDKVENKIQLRGLLKEIKSQVMYLNRYLLHRIMKDIVMIFLRDSRTTESEIIIHLELKVYLLEELVLEQCIMVPMLPSKN